MNDGYIVCHYSPDAMIILGHRGYSARYPENTLLSFQKAIEAGADGVELDIWLTADGRVVVHHDENLKRTFGVDLKIKESRYEDIKDLKCDEERIPRLEEVYEILPENTLINVEIKDRDAVPHALQIVKKYRAMDRTLFSSFDFEALKKLRKFSGDARIGILLGSCRDGLLFPIRGKKIHAEFVNPPILARKKLGILFLIFLHLYKFLGYKVAMWTVDDPEEIDDIRNLCDIVITDDVEKLVNYAREIKEEQAGV